MFQTQAFGKVLVLDGKHDASAMYKAALPSKLSHIKTTAVLL